MLTVPSQSSGDVEFKTYLFEYRHADQWWALEIKACDAEDARARVRTLAFAQYRGEVAAKVSASLTFFPLARVGRLIRKLLSGGGTFRPAAGKPPTAQPRR